jgi:uncharacterized protein YjiS (DUF1127 family)
MNFLTSLLRRSEQHKAYSDLLQLDDHLLRDIGLTRSGIHKALAGARSRSIRAHE